MTPDDIIKFGKEGGIGTCVSKINVPKDSDLLPCQAGDIITILKPIDESKYLGLLGDNVGHFNLRDVNLIYLNLSPATPRRNMEKYQSFTALLGKDIPTGIYELKEGLKAFPSSQAIISELEDEPSMEELSIDSNLDGSNNLIAHSLNPNNHIDVNITSNKLNINEQSYLRESTVLPDDSRIILPETIRSLPIENNLSLDSDKQNKTQEVSRTKPLERDLTPTNVTPQSSLSPKISPRPSPGRPLNLAVHPSMDSQFDSSGRSEISTKSNKGLMSSFRKMKKKASNLFLTAQLDPSIILLPSSHSLPVSPTYASGSESSSLKEFYVQAHQHGQSMQVDEFGFILSVSDDEHDDAKSSLSGATNGYNGKDQPLRLDVTKEGKWWSITNKWSPSKARNSYRVKKLVEKGIPDGIRGKVWQFLANADMNRKPGAYQELLAREKVPIYDVIERDIRRTYPKHAMFYYEGSKALKDLDSVLKAYAQYNPEVGYCQGMGMLVGLFLMQNLDEEDTFWLLASTNAQYLQGYFTPTLAQLRVHAAVFEHLLNQHDPKLAKHLADNDITPLLYVTPWFLTVYTMTLPWASVLRVWDLFYFKGIKTLFRIGLAIMTCVRSHIFRECPTAAELMPFLLHLPHEFLDPDTLMQAYQKVKITTANILDLCRRATNPDGTVPERGALKVR